MFKFFKFCKHDYILVASIGGDVQAYAHECRKCSKKKVDVYGITGKPDFDYVVRNGVVHSTGWKS